MQFVSFAVIIKRIRAIRHMMRDKSVSFWKKALIVFGVIYLVLPVDLIPPVIPVFGFLDDIILWLFILDYLKNELDQYWEKEAPQADFRQDREGKKKYRGKNIIDGVEYEVREDAEPSSGEDPEGEKVSEEPGGGPL